MYGLGDQSFCLRLVVYCGSGRRSLLLSEEFKEGTGDDEHSSTPLLQRELMVEHNVRDDDGEELSGGCNESQVEAVEERYGQEDEDLAYGSCRPDDDDLHEQLRVST